MNVCLVQRKFYIFTLHKQSKAFKMEQQIPETGKFTKKEVENIRELIRMAGGVKFIAGKCGVSVDSFQNPLRGLSSDYTAVTKMVEKAKTIVTKKVTQLA